jgi:hypothetical protein
MTRVKSKKDQRKKKKKKEETRIPEVDCRRSRQGRRANAERR